VQISLRPGRLGRHNAAAPGVIVAAGDDAPPGVIVAAGDHATPGFRDLS
jgi:hypothetical protein